MDSPPMAERRSIDRVRISPSRGTFSLPWAEGIHDLRNALHDDLHEKPRRFRLEVLDAAKGQV
jgi:hypothetical protein